MILKKCNCGGAAKLRTEYDGKVYAARAVCERCGKQGRKGYANQQRGATAIYWATMYWNCRLYEQEGKA